MGEVTRILDQVQQGEPHAAEQLLVLVYDELRKLAGRKLAGENPGQTLEATALVHEAYLRLVGDDAESRWDHRGHFFAAAAEAMRRILVENARRKQTQKHGGTLERRDFDPERIAGEASPDPFNVLVVHDALDRLAEKHSRKAELVKLRYFLGCTVAEAAQILDITPATAEDDWTYAKAWLRRELNDRDAKNARHVKKAPGVSPPFSH